MLKRRTIIETGVLGNMVLDGCVAYSRVRSKWSQDTCIELDNSHPYGFLTPQDRAALVAFSGVLLDRQLGALSEKKTSLIDIAIDIDNAISSYTDLLKEEMRDIFDLLHFPLIRKFLAGIKDPWHVADRKQLEHFLDSWKRSSIKIFQDAVITLQDLIFGAWYENPRSW